MTMTTAAKNAEQQFNAMLKSMNKSHINLYIPTSLIVADKELR